MIGRIEKADVGILARWFDMVNDFGNRAANSTQGIPCDVRRAIASPGLRLITRIAAVTASRSTASEFHPGHQRSR